MVQDQILMNFSLSIHHLMFHGNIMRGNEYRLLTLYPGTDI